MSLQVLLDLSNKSTIKQGISEERLRNNLPELRKMIAFYRFYPDLFVDEMSGYAQWIRDGNKDSEWKGFKFLTYQRAFLRTQMRYKFTYGVYPRA